jgi:hypothetical protein
MDISAQLISISRVRYLACYVEVNVCIKTASELAVPRRPSYGMLRRLAS